MTIKRSSTIILAAIAAIVTGYVYADTSSSGGSNQWYIDGNAGYSSTEGAQNAAPVSYGGTGYGIDLGYMFSPYFGLEGGYFNSGSAATTEVFNEGINSQTGYVAAKGVWPIVHWFDIYGKLGLGYSSSTINSQVFWINIPQITSNSGTLLTSGGIQFNLSDNFGVHAEVQYMDQQLGNPSIPLNTLSELLGIEFKF